MPLRGHAGAVIRTEGREHLVTARDAAAAGAGRARVLVRPGSGEDLIHHAGDRIASKADIDPERRGIPATLPLDELNDRGGAVAVIEPIGRAPGAKPVELESLAQRRRQTARSSAGAEGFQERRAVHPARPIWSAVRVDVREEV